MKKSVMSLKDITKTYFSEEVDTQVLHDIDLEVKFKEFLAIMGPSGSGKSTLLHIVGLLDNATTGKYILNGNDVTKLTEDEQAFARNKEIGFVFQSFNLLQRASVLDNVILPAIYAGTNREEREKRARELLDKVGLTNHYFKKPNQLSGGQQQRVAIARALMNNPPIILADEPTGNLDSVSSHEIMKLLRTLNEEGKTIVVITHDSDIAEHAERLVRIKDGRLFEG